MYSEWPHNQDAQYCDHLQVKENILNKVIERTDNTYKDENNHGVTLTEITAKLGQESTNTKKGKRVVNQ